MAASAFQTPLAVARDVPLAPKTTLGVGGAARWLWPVSSHDDVVAGLDFAAARGCPWWVLGGGSNVVIADAGLPGVVLHPVVRGPLAPFSVVADDGRDVCVRASAGALWDDLVAWAVDGGLQGIECLSGIPGQCGAAPIQNIGAYGQEVGEVLVAVEGVDTAARSARRWPVGACGLSYRESRFKRSPGEAVLLSIELKLRRGGTPCQSYAQVASALQGSAPVEAGPTGLGRVRAAVLALRRAKGMVVDVADPDSRSCGSFFTNPVVPDEVAAQVRRKFEADGPMPHWPAADGQVKLSAAWLIERSGWNKGDGGPRVGLSTKHALAVVCRGEASAAEVLAFAAQVAERVRSQTGVSLLREPVGLGW